MHEDLVVGKPVAEHEIENGVVSAASHVDLNAKEEENKDEENEPKEVKE